MRPAAPSERFVPWLAALLAAIPALAFRYPPTIDYPQHESLVALLRDHVDPARFVGGMYETNLGHPNQLFHLVAFALSFAVGVPLACRLTLAAALAAIPLGAAWLARRSGATPWIALAMVPVALGYLLYWGFVTNLVGVAVLLFVLGALHDFEDAPTWRGALAASVAAIALYFAHQLMLFVFLLAIGFAALRNLRPVRLLPLRVAPAMVGVAITLAQQRWQANLFVPGSAPDALMFLPLGEKLAHLAYHLWGAATEDGAWGPMTLSLAAIALLVLARDRRDEGRDERSALARFVAPNPRAARLFVLGAACFAIYLAAPHMVNGASFVFQRFAAPAYALLLAWAAASVTDGGTRASRLALAAVGAVGFAIGVRWFAVADRMEGELEPIVARIAPRSAVAGIDLDHDRPRERPFTAIHWALRALVEKGGRAGLSFTTSPIAPVRLATRYQWNDSAWRFEHERRFVPAVDFRRFRYLVLHSLDARLLDDAVVALDAEASVVARSGEWILFESRGEAMPFDAADAPVPVPSPESLVDRLMKREELATGATGSPSPGR